MFLEHYFSLLFQSKHLTFLLHDNISIATITIIIAWHLLIKATHVIHVSSSLISTHATQLHVIYASTSPTQPALARYPRKHTTHATHVSMSPHASTLPTQPSLACSHATAPPRKRISHANHTSTNSKPFFKLFQQKLRKIDPRSGNFIHSKRCMIPFLNVPLRRTISKQLTISITQKLLIDQEIMEMHMEYIPDQFLRNILQVKKKDGGNRPCINLKALSKFISKWNVCIAWNTFSRKTIFSERQI